MIELILLSELCYLLDSDVMMMMVMEQSTQMNDSRSLEKIRE